MVSRRFYPAAWFLPLAAALYTFCILALHSQAFALRPELLSGAVTFDFTISVPCLYWWFMVRNARWPALSLLPVLVLCLGQLLARQAEAFAEDEKLGEKFGDTCDKLPNDIINFQHDLLTCAIALGWNDGVEISEVPLKTELRNSLLDRSIDARGKPTQIVTKINGERFSQFWIDTIAGVART